MRQLSESCRGSGRDDSASAVAVAGAESDAVAAAGAATAGRALSLLSAAPEARGSHPKRGGRDFCSRSAPRRCLLPCRAAIELLPDRVAGLFSAEGIEVAADDVEVWVRPGATLSASGRTGDRYARDRTRVRRRGGFRRRRPPTKAAEGFARQGMKPHSWRCAKRAGAASCTTSPAARAVPGSLLPSCSEDRARHVLPQECAGANRDLRFSRPYGGGPCGAKT